MYYEQYDAALKYQKLLKTNPDANKPVPVQDRLKAGLEFCRKLKRKRQSKQSPGYVYLVGCNGMVKIGIARNLIKRFYSLRVGIPYPVVLIDSRFCTNARRQEQNLHRRYRKFRTKGEWFDLPKSKFYELLDWFPQNYRMFHGPLRDNEATPKGTAPVDSEPASREKEAIISEPLNYI